MDLLAEKLSSALPDRFDFYHLGRVERIADKSGPGPFDETSLKAIAFALRGEVRGVFIAYFDRALDASTYTEMANVLASKLATELNRRDGLLVSLSPPREIEMSAARALIAKSKAIRCEYAHRHGGFNTTIRTCFIQASPEEIAHA